MLNFKIRDIEFKGFISYQISPLNGREQDSAMFVYNKMISIINSCENTKQLRSVGTLPLIFDTRFPDHYEFTRQLFSEISYKREKLLEQIINNG